VRIGSRRATDPFGFEGSGLDALFVPWPTNSFEKPNPSPLRKIAKERPPGNSNPHQKLCHPPARRSLIQNSAYATIQINLKKASETETLFERGLLERNFLGLRIELRFFRHLLLLGPVEPRLPTMTIQNCSTSGLPAVLSRSVLNYGRGDSRVGLGTSVAIFARTLWPFRV
jgi:hypothetical protein